MFRMHEDHVNAEDGRSYDVDDERKPAFMELPQKQLVSKMCSLGTSIILP